MRTGWQKKTLKEKYNVVAADNLLRREKKVKKGKLKFWSSDAVGTQLYAVCGWNVVV